MDPEVLFAAYAMAKGGYQVLEAHYNERSDRIEVLALIKDSHATGT